jgi:predicted RNase H-like HicB family nuclease
LASKILRCYAEGRDGEWEAICLDLDIAVQGRSFEDVFRSLRKAIALYLQTIADLRPDERRLLLRRRTPLSVRLKFVIDAVRVLLSAHRGRKRRHLFTMPLDA